MIRIPSRAGMAAMISMMISMVLFGQPADAPGDLKFEAADVHISPAAAPGANQYMRGGFYRGGRYEVRTATMLDLIRTAWGVEPDKVVGGPAWLANDRFDIIAKAPLDSTPENLKLMLRNLLAERFSLKVHDDTKPLPAYALLPGKKPQLKPADASGETGCKLAPQPDPPAGSPAVGMVSLNGVVMRLGPGSLIDYVCRNVTMPAFADELRSMIFVPSYLNGNRVVDETELKGAWDFELKYSLNMRVAQPAENAPEVVTVFNALDKQLGLKLELTKVPTPVIAVDSVNEKPTDNLPGVTEKMPVLPTEFEVADIRPSDPNPQQGVFRQLFQPGGRVNLTNDTLNNLVATAWNLRGNADNMIVGGPKFMTTNRWDVIAKASTSQSLYTPASGPAPPAQVDYDAMTVMLQALLKDRFKLVLHKEDRPMSGYALVAVKPKLKKADPSNRSGCNEGPGPDGKDPRIANPAAGRLLSCLNMTMADFAAALPNLASGYFGQLPGGVVDVTQLEGAWDFTLSFSAAGMLNGGGGGRGGGDAGPSAAQASDPNGAVISLQEAVEKQLGLKLESQKNPASVLVIDHIEEKPTDN